MRPTVLEVNLSAIKSNVRAIQNLTNNKNIIAVVKADAYGLGSIPVTEALRDAGVGYFSVALIEEAEILRDHGVTEPILLLAPFSDRDIPELIRLSITPTLSDYPSSTALNAYAATHNLKVPVHIKLDTGMGRLGFPAREGIRIFAELSSLSNLVIEGIYTHFPSADIPDRDFTNEQIAIFSALTERFLRDFKPKSRPMIHLANSGGIIHFPESHFDAVRPGIILYGCHPSSQILPDTGISKVITLKTSIVSIKELRTGESLSYGRTFTADRLTKVAILPVGYADGISTLLSNKGEAVIRNLNVPVIGRVTMDYTMIDVTDLSDPAIGEEVILIGAGITEESLSEKTGLIPYEILCSISKRVPRRHIYS
ncbi:MAG: alanine racemase [Spirochaetota bacterium]|nr:alanine racemase [Spirochaetota bacterium]